MCVTLSLSEVMLRLLISEGKVIEEKGPTTKLKFGTYVLTWSFSHACYGASRDLLSPTIL